VLRALNRLLRPGGRIAFTTIEVAPGLTEAARRRAQRDGPRAVGTSSTYERLLASAGFVDIDVVDVTASFIETARAWIDLRAEHADELEPLEAPGSFETRQADHRAQLAATEEGLLRRSLISTVRPRR
jgi:hypothetical protein